MTKTFCDRCEKEIVRKIFFISTWDGKVTDFLQDWKRKSLCQPCFTALELFLNNK